LGRGKKLQKKLREKSPEQNQGGRARTPQESGYHTLMGGGVERQGGVCG